MKYFVTVGSRDVEVELGPDGIFVDGDPVEAELAQLPGTEVHHLLLDGASHRVVAAREGRGSWSLHLGGRTVAAEVVDERTRTIRELAGTGAGPSGPAPVVAPMPGLVVKVQVAVGDEVAAGQGMAIVEAMKMENELRASGPGVVSAIHVAAGDAVEKDQVLIDLDPLPAEDDQEEEG